MVTFKGQYFLASLPNPGVDWINRYSLNVNIKTLIIHYLKKRLFLSTPLDDMCFSEDWIFKNIVFPAHYVLLKAKHSDGTSDAIYTIHHLLYLHSIT